jgi:hypothetical protein
MWLEQNPETGATRPFQGNEKQKQVPFDDAQGRLSTPLRFAQDDSFVVISSFGQDYQAHSL